MGTLSFMKYLITVFICLPILFNLSVTITLGSFNTKSRKKWNQIYIAVLSQPNKYYQNFYSPDNTDFSNFPLKNSYIASSYIKYTEASGVQTLLLPWDLPWAQTIELLQKAHGLVLPG